MTPLFEGNQFTSGDVVEHIDSITKEVSRWRIVGERGPDYYECVCVLLDDEEEHRYIGCVQLHGFTHLYTRVEFPKIKSKNRF
jgi:hypothetical protein